MKFYIFNKSIVGYKNIIKKKVSQDYLKVERLDEGLICAIADGHSDDFFTESHKGSQFACEVAIEVMKKYINEKREKIKLLLENKIIQKEVCDKWRERVDLDIQNTLPKVFKYNYFKYGTTLLVVLINEDSILYMKLGDGNILLNRNGQIEQILSPCKENIVNSMAEDKSYEKILFSFEENKKDISDIIIFSDGFENSFTSYDRMADNLKQTISEYKKNVFLKYKLEKNYDNYLSNLSKCNSFDDISIVFVNIL